MVKYINQVIGSVWNNKFNLVLMQNFGRVNFFPCSGKELLDAISVILL